MKKVMTTLLILAYLFFFLTVAIIYNGNFNFNSYLVISLFAVGLSLISINQLYLTNVECHQFARFELLSNNKLAKLILLLINICLLLFISWILIRADVKAFPMAIWMFFTVMFIWLYCASWVNKISISYIIMLGISLRLIWCFAVYPQPYGDFYVYWMTAQKMFYGIIPFQTKSPLTIIFYGIVSYVFDKQLWGVYIVNSLLAGLQIWLIYRITRLITASQLSPIISAALYAFYPAAITFSAIVSSESLMITLSLGAIYCLFKKLCVDSCSREADYYWLKNLLLLAAISLCLAGAYFARNTAMLLLVTSIFAIVLFSSNKVTQRIGESLLILSLFFGCLTPQIVSNFHYYGKFSIESQHLSGLVLLNGTSRKTNGVIDRDKLKQVLTDLGYSQEDLKRKKTVIDAVSKHAYGLAMADIMSNKTDFIKFAMTNKFNKMWVNDNYWYFITYQAKAFDHGMNQLAKRTIDKISTQYYFGLWLLALCSILFSCYKKNILISIMASYIILTFCLHVFYEVSTRYHMPVMPFVCIMASYWISADFLSNPARERKWQLIINSLKNITKIRKSAPTANY